MQRLLVLALVLSTSACLFQPTSDPGGADAANDHDATTVSDAGPDDATHPTWDVNVTHDATRPDAHTEDVWTSDATTEPDMGPPVATIVRTTAGLVSHYIFEEDLDDRVRSNAPLGLFLDNGRASGYALLGGEYDDLLASEDFSFETSVYVEGSGTVIQCGNQVRLVAAALDAVPDLNHIPLSVTFGSKEVVVPDALVRSGRTHIAWVRENTIVRLYVRGALVAATEVNANVGVHGCALGEYQTGGRDNVEYESLALYDRALSPGEVAMHAVAGPGIVETVDHELTDLAVRVHARTGVSSSAARARTATIIEGSASDVPDGEFTLGSKILMQFGEFAGAKGVPGEVVSSRLHVLGPLQTSGASLKVYPMLRGWNEHATWTVATENTPWDVAGATGAFDRGPYVDEALVTEHTTLAVDLDVTSLVAEWVDDEHNNNGVQIECTTCNGLVFPDAPSSAARPMFVTISNAPRPARPAAPEVEFDEQFMWQEYNSTVEVEVYHSDRLLARVPGKYWRPDEGLRNVVLTFIAVDAWGQRSPRATATAVVQ